MSYFVVPSVSYQTQQKLEKQQKEKERRAKRKKKHGSSGSESTRSSTGSKHSHDTIGELPDNDDNKSIISTTSTLSKHSTHPGTSRSSSNFKPLTQLKETQPVEQQTSSPQNQQESFSSPNLSKKSSDSPVFKQEYTRQPDFEESAQVDPVEQHVPRERSQEINEQATIIASRYGEALKTGGSNRSVATPTATAFSKSSPVNRRRSGSVISSGSVPSGHHIQNQVFQRNASISSGLSQTSQNSGTHSTKDSLSFRKLSFLGSSSKRRGSLASSPGTSGSPGSSGKQEGYFPEYPSNTSSPGPVSAPSTQQHTGGINFRTPTPTPPPPMKTLPPFKANIDLTVYNNRDALERNFVAPNYQVFRYNSFLDLLNECESADAISISSIRFHLLMKFISKQKNAKEFLSQGNKLSFGSSYGLMMADSVLAYHLYGPMRSVLRELIKIRSNNQAWRNHEELVQCNFINFVRYVAALPDNVNVAELNDIEKKIYKFKEVFSQTANAMYLLKKEQSPDSNSADIVQYRIKLLIEAITKVAYEYLLLEKYRLDITTKYHNNHLIDKRILKKLFYRYETNVRSKNSDNVKVLLFNSSNSIQYAWYMSLSMPFLRVIETHVYTEDRNLIENLDQYRNVELATPKLDFTESDQELFDTYMKKLAFKSYGEFEKTSMDKLVKLHRSIDNQSPKYAKINRHEMPDPATNFSFKPMNFEYYNSSLATFPNESFDAVLSPDLAIQSTVKTYKTLLSEFYRILKPGGTLIIDCLQYGAKNIHEFFKRFKNGEFPETLENEDFGVLKFFDTIPRFTETILKELNVIFGKGNVQFNISLLSSASDVNGFTIKFVGMRLFEVVGRFDEYCDSFTEVGETFKSELLDSIHFSIHIRAVKPT